MSELANPSIAFKDSKQHYQILDALRGVAAIVVVFFHIFEIFANGDHTKQMINHGYLAVDFFFVLSGFVIGYAYDDRWNSMTFKGFVKRRLIRLQPMIVMGMLLGAVLYYFQAGPMFPDIATTAVWKVVLVMFIGMTLLPLTPSMEIRGWNEMHPLNGPAWSLFFEYIGNFLYALLLRKVSNKVLAIFTFIAGAVLLHMAITRGDVIGGWAFNAEQFYVGFTRLLYPFLAGLLLSRIAQPGKIKNAYLWAAIILTLVLALPRIGGHEEGWMNGIYDALVIILVFPFIVYLGASGRIVGHRVTKFSAFLGNISYPLYITHYPIMYIFMSAMVTHEYFKNPFAPGNFTAIVLWAVATLVASLAIAHFSFKYFDVPVRKWLTKRFMTK